MSIKPWTWSISFILLLLSAGTWAATPSGTTISDGSSASSSLLNHLYLNYFGIYHGSPVDDLGSPSMVDTYGKKTNRNINFDSEITAAYQLDHDFAAGFVVPF